MTQTLANATSLTIKCPDCGDETGKQVIWFLKHKRYFCPACGHEQSLIGHEIKSVAEQLYNAGTQHAAISLKPNRAKPD